MRKFLSCLVSFSLLFIEKYKSAVLNDRAKVLWTQKCNGCCQSGIEECTMGSNYFCSLTWDSYQYNRGKKVSYMLFSKRSHKIIKLIKLKLIWCLNFKICSFDRLSCIFKKNPKKKFHNWCNYIIFLALLCLHRVVSLLCLLWHWNNFLRVGS